MTERLQRKAGIASKKKMNIEKNILDVVNQWLTPVFDVQTQEEIRDMLAFSPGLLQDSFYKNLEFGTGGMRGVMGVGTNRINRYTLGKNTQGIANYMKMVFGAADLKVAIAFDCRHNSQELAKVVADVFSANGILVYLFSDLRPTPELSFAVKLLGCQAGIVLTASHNPPEYNGYKVYWQDGGQLVPPQDAAIIKEIEAVAYDAILFEANDNLIQYIGQDVDAAFVASCIKNASFDTASSAKDNLSIVFTALHGTSITIVPQTLAQAGYKNVQIVAEQAVPNGDFPTVKSPNPEEPEALKMALELAEITYADIVVGTDPDCDRLGVGVRNEMGEMILLNGNQSMILMTAFLLEKWQMSGRLNGQQFVGSTIVSTPMMAVLANHFGVECKVGLTGFKWIAKMIHDFETLEFIGGGEESFGYMVGDAVRDKDAVAATLLMCEMAAQAKANGSSVFKKMIDLYIKHGFFKEHLVSITKKGIDGLAAINTMMVNLRSTGLQTINNQKVIMVEDYQSSISTNLLTMEQQKINLPQSDVLIFYTADGSKIAARPSGTEPKIKFYISVNTPLKTAADYEKTSLFLDQKINDILLDLNLDS